MRLRLLRCWWRGDGGRSRSNLCLACSRRRLLLLLDCADRKMCECHAPEMITTWRCGHRTTDELSHEVLCQHSALLRACTAASQAWGQHLLEAQEHERRLATICQGEPSWDHRDNLVRVKADCSRLEIYVDVAVRAEARALATAQAECFRACPGGFVPSLFRAESTRCSECHPFNGPPQCHW